jgi:ABC-type glycerol-3-phosphate transport system substrate-binding protein
MLRRLCVALTLGILLLAALAQGAAADPTNAKNSVTFPTTCDGQTVQFVLNGNGEFTAAHVVGSTTVFIPQALNVTFEFTPPGGPTDSMTDTASKSNVHGDLVTCSVDVTLTFPEGTVHAFGTVTGFFTPAS